MKLLALESSDRVAQVALYLDGEVYALSADASKKHAETLLPTAERLLSEHGLTTADMDAFAADIGPGSFTGVRIGVCTANALGFAHQKPVVAVNALEALAYGVPGRVLALIDARNGNAYAAAYEDGRETLAPCAGVTAEFLEEHGDGAVLVGSAANRDAYPTAAAVAHIAAGREGCERLVPMYLRPPQAERMAEARK